MQFEELTTPRLTLVKIDTEAYNRMFKTMPDEAIMQLYGFDQAGLEKEKQRYEGGISTFNKKILYFILKQKSTGDPIGICGYHTWYTDHNCAELFYFLYSDLYKRQGIMTEAVQTVLEYGYNDMGLHRVEAMTAKYNEASKKTLAKFGFTFEGTLREHYLVDGKMEDSLMFSLLKREFNNRRIREAKISDIEGMSAVRMSVKENVLNNPELVKYEDYVNYITEFGKGWVAKVNGEIRGFAIASLKHNNIWALFVHPDFERKGLGKQLHDTMMNWYFSQTSEPAWLSTAPGTRAEAFYKKAGWTDIGMYGKEIKFEMRR